MSTLMSMKVLGKKRPRICGAACYNAKHSYCVCVCQGVNHQKGLEIAVQQTRELVGTASQEVRFGRVVTSPSLRGL